MSSHLTSGLRLVFSGKLDLTENFSIFAIYDLANHPEEELWHELFVDKRCPQLEFDVLEREKMIIANNAHRFYLNSWLLNVVKWAVKNGYALNITSVEPYTYVWNKQCEKDGNDAIDFMFGLKVRTEAILSFAKKNHQDFKMGFSYEKVSKRCMKNFYYANRGCIERGCSCYLGSEYQKGRLPLDHNNHRNLFPYLYRMNMRHVDTETTKWGMKKIFSYKNDVFTAYDDLQTVIYRSVHKYSFKDVLTDLFDEIQFRNAHRDFNLLLEEQRRL